MHQAAQTLVGTHDFSSFRSAHCQAKSPIKTIDEIIVSEIENRLLQNSNAKEIQISIKAPSFLHNQVRIIVGQLYEIGRKKTNENNLQNILDAQDRTQTALTAPAQGLYLANIEYKSMARQRDIS